MSRVGAMVVILAAGCAGGDDPLQEADVPDPSIEVVVRTLDSSTGFALPEAGLAPAPALDAAAVLDAALDASVPEACDLRGKWAVALRANVGSSATEFTSSSGEARVWLLLDVSGANGAYSARSSVCSVQLPLVVLRPEHGRESYRMQFPRGGEGLPSADLRLRSSADGVELDAFAALLGVRPSTQASDGWPSDGASVEYDADGDGRAGLSVTWSSSDGRVLPPVDTDKTARARTSELSARVVFGASKLDGCRTWDGSSGAVRIESHMLGCTLAGGGACSAAQRDLLEVIRPQYTGSRASLRATRLRSSSDCDDVLRAAQ